jgi:hypothetical protein
VSEVVNFLAHLFKEGYQYCFLNAYRLSVHERVDGYQVGQHPLGLMGVKSDSTPWYPDD